MCIRDRCYIGMSLLGLDYALLISSVVALGALIPILGAYIGAAVGVIVLLLVHPIDALIFLIFLLCLQQIEGNLIYPRVVGSSIGLPPVWTLSLIHIFLPELTLEEYAVMQIQGTRGLDGCRLAGLTAALIGEIDDRETLERLEQAIQEKKQQLS